MIKQLSCIKAGLEFFTFSEGELKGALVFDALADEGNNEDFGSQACALRFQALMKEIEVLSQCFDNLRGAQKAALVRTSLRYENIKKVGLNLIASLKQVLLKYFLAQYLI